MGAEQIQKYIRLRALAKRARQTVGTAPRHSFTNKFRSLSFSGDELEVYVCPLDILRNDSRAVGVVGLGAANDLLARLIETDLD